MANPEHLAKLQEALAHDDITIWNNWIDGQRWTATHEPETGRYRLGRFRADLGGATLGAADLTRLDLLDTNLSFADLRNSRLVETNLENVNLAGANLQDAYFRRTNLISADLRGADLRKSVIDGAIFDDTKLAYTDLSFSNMAFAILANVDLSQVKGLDTVITEFSGSEISISTLYRSGGNISEVFLRGCGVPETMITFAKSLVGKPIQFYSAFISYSSKDEDFAERLHADLQARGVRVWFAPEDLKIGDKFRTRIDEAIRVYDKLMVVLSENSVSSPWVEEEVEAALERERRENRLVLFPIRLDDAMMHSDKAWAASIRRIRHIGDFTKWKSHDDYQKSFERLLRDLNAEPTVR